MIKSFRDKDTKAFFEEKAVKRFSGFKNVAERKPTLLDSAAERRDLLGPPANRLEKLTGNRGGQHSIRINDQWRICFVWKNDGPYEVEITDYH
jgi:toxin HigB-1